MAKLIYISNVTLDGYIEDEHGNFDWSAPDDEVFAFITDLVRSVGTHLYGRRLYGTMAVWETTPPWPPNRNSWATSQTSGRPRTRSSTPRPWTLYLPPRPSNPASTHFGDDGFVAGSNAANHLRAGGGT